MITPSYPDKYPLFFGDMLTPKKLGILHSLLVKYNKEGLIFILFKICKHIIKVEDHKDKHEKGVNYEENQRNKILEQKWMLQKKNA